MHLHPRYMHPRTTLTIMALVLTAQSAISSSAWQTYRRSDGYHQIIDFAGATYVQAGQMLMRGSQRDGSDLQVLSPRDGLSGQDVYTIVSPADASYLAVIYLDGDIDVIHTDGTLTTLSGLQNYAYPGIDKTIRSLSIVGHVLYLACNFGFVAIDPLTEEFLVTCPSPTPCTRAFFYQGAYYRERTDVGMEYCTSSANMQRPEEWQPVSDTSSLPDYRPKADVARLSALPAYQGMDLTDCCLMKASGGQLIAMQSQVHHLTWGESSVRGQYSRLDMASGTWSTASYSTLSKQVPVSDRQGFTGILQFSVDPADPSHLFISTASNLLFELYDDQIVRHYTPDNSALLYWAEYAKDRFGRVGGMDWDDDGNLWITNNGNVSNFQCLTPSGQWYSFSHPVFTHVTQSNTLVFQDHIAITIDEHWGSDIYYYDTQGTLADTSDDTYGNFSLNDEYGNPISTDYLCAIARNPQGHIWILSRMGVFMAESLRSLIEDTSHRTYRPLLQKANSTDGDTYLLRGVDCQCIAFGTGDDMWIGTIGNGLYHVTADGSRILDKFTTSNSGLLNNSIYAIAVDPATGIVYASCDGGIVSYDARKAGDTDITDLPLDFSQVRVIPEQIPMYSHAALEISGLPAETYLLITDTQMQTLVDTQVTDGHFSWDLVSLQQSYLSPGIYNVYASTPTLPLRLIATISREAPAAPATASQSGK